MWGDGRTDGQRIEGEMLYQSPGGYMVNDALQRWDLPGFMGNWGLVV